MWYEPLTTPLVLLLISALLGLLLIHLLLRRQSIHDRAQLGVLRMDQERVRLHVEDMERRTAEQEQWARTLLNRTTDIVLVHSVSANGKPGTFIEVNDAACTILRYTRERLLSMTIFDVEHSEPPSTMRAYARLHDTDSTVRGLAALENGDLIEPENVIEMRRRMKGVLASGQAVYEQTLVTRDGRQIPVEVHANRGERWGRPVILLSIKDLTERQETLQALSDTERLSRDIFAHSAVGAVIFDGERVIANVNRIALRMFGAGDQTAFAQLNLFEPPFVPPEHQEALNRGETVHFETTLDFDDIRQRGLIVSTRTGRAHFNVFMNNLGLDKHYQPKGYLVQVQDFTQRREIELELKQRDLQLRQAQKLQAIGTLAGGVAHDFNNLLTPVLGYAEMALDLCADNETIREYLREVVRASLRAKELANQILTFSRQVEPEGKPIRLIPIVKEVLNLQRATLTQGVQISRVIQTDRDILIADPSQLHQIMMNLFTNAAHAMRGRTGEIEVTVGEAEVPPRPRGQYANLAPGRYLKVSVRDAGMGIDQAVADRIFEPFFTTKARGEGTGMGLAVVHGIVNSLKGLITFESMPGEGTVFHVMLPAAEISEDAAESSEDAVPGGSECILFVDDEVDIVRMQSRMLASLGYRPVVTHRSTEALRLYQQHPDRYPLIIADQVMPEMSGLDLARHVHDIRPDQPVIICSGFADSLPVEQRLAFGVRAVLRKPVSKRELAQAIRTALDESPPARLPADSPPPKPPPHGAPDSGTTAST
ncbi:MAG: PAS domain S-box protein [Lentisphaerae bacterium]|nr:PAS domain S-box protein [Lentisphaerota bacterium]